MNFVYKGKPPKQVDLLRYQSLLNWNSKFPPERYRYLHFGFAVSTLTARIKVSTWREVTRVAQAKAVSTDRLASASA